MRFGTTTVRRRIGAGVLAVFSAGAILALVGTFGGGAERRAPVAPCLTEGATNAYRWAMTTAVMPDGSVGRREETDYSGTLHVRVLSSGAGRTLALRFTSVTVRVMGVPRPEIAEALSVPFTVDVDPSGRFGDSRFPPGLSRADRMLLDGAIRSTQLVLPPDGADRWETTETDANGDYVSAYSREGETVTKHRERYTSLAAKAPLSIEIAGSLLKAELGGSTAWLRRAEGSESLRIRASDGTPVARVEARFRLDPSPDASVASSPPWDTVTLESIRIRRDAPSTAASAWDEAEYARQRERFLSEGITLDRLLSALAGHPPGDARFAHEFSAFLRAFPAEADRLGAKLRAVAPADLPLLFNVLELAGTSEAQHVLLAFASDGRRRTTERALALAALAGVEAPTAWAMERLWRDARTGEDPALTSTALLALGALAQRAPSAQSELTIARIASELRVANDPDRQVVCLRALRNSGGPLDADEASRLLRSDNPVVRGAVSELVAERTALDGGQAFAQILRDEPDASVRQGLLAGLPMGVPAAPVNAAIAGALAGERDAGVRAQMVQLLVGGLSTYPANRAVLEAELRRETDRQVIVAILNSLSR